LKQSESSKIIKQLLAEGSFAITVLF